MTLIVALCWLLGFATMAPAFSRDASAGIPPLITAPAIETAISSQPHGLSGLETLRSAADRLRPEALARASPEEVKNRTEDWMRALAGQGTQPLLAIGEILPSSLWFQTRLVMKRDEAALKEDAAHSGPYGAAYARLRDALPLSQATNAAVESVLDRVWRESSRLIHPKRGPAPVLKRSDYWLPSTSTLSSAHQYALDIFFTAVKRHGAEERGPAIKSVSSGIVVAAADDWAGGDKPSLYQGGGLSPKAGNGVIVYDPDAGLYYAYFHLSVVEVYPGQIVEAGDTLGHGGNTGVNARKKGHGGHVHLEIHGADGQAWTSRRIRELVASIR